MARVGPTAIIHLPSSKPHERERNPMAEAITLDHLRAVMDYVSQHESITNRECRVATGLGYDSAIKIFGALCALGMLKKIGEASGTKYVVADVRTAVPSRPGYHRKKLI